MASIRKRGGSYLLVVSVGYTPDGRRRNPQQRTVKPPAGLTPKQTEKWLQEQAMLFEMSCKKMNPDIDRSITLHVTCTPSTKTKSSQSDHAEQFGNLNVICRKALPNVPSDVKAQTLLFHSA